MKIALIGGHLSPTLSVIEKIPKNWKIIFIGRKYIFEGDVSISPEYNIINDLGIEFENLTTGRFQRKLTRHTVPSLFKLPTGFFTALKILHKHQPDIILGFGGYIQLPVIFASFLMRIPTVIHEQTLEAGAANQISAKFAKKICISWESSRKFFPKDKIVLTGIPLRREIIEISKEKISTKKDIPQIFITGGSSGSHFVNKLTEDALENILVKYKVVHQTGNSRKFNDFDRLNIIKKTFPDELRKNYALEKFIDPQHFPRVMKDSDLIISRAGINTVSEILYFSKPCILIPIPFAQKNEQFKNSLFLKNLGLAEIIEQKNATSNLLTQKIKMMLNSQDNYKIKKFENLSFEKAAGTIIEILKKCAEEN